jgi:phage shock protein A
LQQRLAQRATLIDVRQQVRNHLHALRQQPQVVASVRERMELLIETFTRQIKDVEREIAAALQQDAAWASAAAWLQTITGVGLITTA